MPAPHDPHRWHGCQGRRGPQAVIETHDRVALGRQRGQLVFKEAGAFHVEGAGEFGELYSVVSGTGDFVGATGVLKAVGTFNAVTGGDIVYQGQICVP